MRISTKSIKEPLEKPLILKQNAIKPPIKPPQPQLQPPNYQKSTNPTTNQQTKKMTNYHHQCGILFVIIIIELFLLVVCYCGFCFSEFWHKQRTQIKLQRLLLRGFTSIGAETMMMVRLDRPPIRRLPLNVILKNIYIANNCYREMMIIIVKGKL